MKTHLAPILFALSAVSGIAQSAPSWSGIYPHLAYFNEEGECGTGAVVPWADRLWLITYGPHLPLGSTDKLYEITPDLKITTRPESVGGTPANRMIHKESKQLIIGSYFIDEARNVRVIHPSKMPGRLTGNARHLTEPQDKVYFATMEEGLYEVDVKSLAVTGLIRDGNGAKGNSSKMENPAKINSKLPGYHGKGLYSGQGRVVYANNGERSQAALTDPRTPSGALGQWFGEGDWQLVRRNQFTEVTGPGGIEGNSDPENDPIWSFGWDDKSAILMVLDKQQWHAFRLPKASHTYDGAHGWNTEWPRIRDVQNGKSKDYLMTMHGSFWKFPATFTATNSAGIRPRSTYLKVIGDFCAWKDQLVFGCDDTARSAFLNERKGDDILQGPGQSHSNLWFTSHDTVDKLGPALGRGAVWVNDSVQAGQVSDPYLLAGFDRRSIHINHGSNEPVSFEFEIDTSGNGQWTTWRSVTVPPDNNTWIEIPADVQGEWIRVKTDKSSDKVHVVFQSANRDTRSTESAALFAGLSQVGTAGDSGALMRVRGSNQRTLLVAAHAPQSTANPPAVYYELDANMALNPLEKPPTEHETQLSTKHAGYKARVDAASVVYEHLGKRWRLPKGDAAFDRLIESPKHRVQREVVTERELLNCHGTFYELPADNAGGIAKVRPIASHNFAITDFVSYRGLLVLSGIDGGKDNRHVIRSADGFAAVWVGTIDDLWKLGKPTGSGGPWFDTSVAAATPSDPYLFAGYDKKSMSLSHKNSENVSIRVEVDITGDGHWVTYQTFDVPAGKTIEHTFPDSFQAYWLRVVANAETVATAQLKYE